MPSLEEIRTRFESDLFATKMAGAVITEAKPGYAVCEMVIRPEHLNANNVPMGGAMFTLGDYAYAIASNAFSESIAVTQNVSITFLTPAKGKKLIAKAECLKSGRQTCLYHVDIHDELDTYVAHMVVNGFVINQQHT